MKIRNGIFGIIILCLWTTVSLGQTDLSVDLKMQQVLPDDVGTNVTYIYDFNVNIESPNIEELTSYIVIFYLDDKYLKGFKDQVLPVSLRQNFIGLTKGRHIMRVDIEDNSNNGKVLSTKFIEFVL